MSMTQITHEWAKKAMELALDYGVDSLRVGSYERKDTLMNNHVYTWETIQLREKRKKSREALARYLASAVCQLERSDPKPTRRLTGEMIYKALRDSGLTRYHQPDSTIQGDYEKCLERFAHTIFNLN